jgi:hypothetical protein
VPDEFAGAEAADRSAILDYVRDDVDLGVTLDEPSAGLLYRRQIQLAEAPAEGD